MRLCNYAFFYHPGSSRAWKKRYIHAAVPLALLFLSSCGGGGSSSPSSPPPPPPPPPVSIPLPANLAASFPENGGFALLTVAEFRVRTTSDALPSGLALDGPDADYFMVNIEVGPVDSSGYRDIKVIISTSTTFDYEDPFDQNKDNVYEFTLTGQYLGQSLRAGVEVSITDVPDAGVISPRIIIGPQNETAFGASITAIPDITGDGKLDLGVNNQSDIRPFSAYILRSDSFESIPEGTAQSAGYHDLLPRALGVLHNSMNSSTFWKLNFLTAQPSQDGSGVDLLISESASNGPIRFKVRGTPPRPALDFDFYPTHLTDANHYPFEFSDNPVALLIPDISGDGIADIFIRFASSTRAIEQFGIIFGAETPNIPSSAVRAPLDITLNAGRSIFDTEQFVFHHPEVKPIGDLDGDGLLELVISFPQFRHGTDFSYKYWIVRGSALAGAIGGNLDLTALPAASGIEREGQLESVVTLPDFNNDGSPTLLLATKSFFTLCEGEALLDPTSTSAGSTPQMVNVTRAGLLIGSRAILAPDLDGDGLPEVIAVNSVRRDAMIIRGSALREAANSGLQNFQLLDQDFIEIDFSRVVDYAKSDAAKPVLLEDSDLVAFGFANLDRAISGQALPGRIILVSISELRAHIEAGQPRIELR